VLQACLGRVRPTLAVGPLSLVGDPAGQPHRLGRLLGRLEGLFVEHQRIRQGLDLREALRGLPHVPGPELLSFRCKELNSPSGRRKFVRGSYFG